MNGPMLLERRSVEPEGPADPIRVMIVDDSIVARAVLARLLEADERFAVAAEAGSAAQALDLLRSRPVDIILLDLEMPGRHGLDALPELLAASAGARVVIVSAACAEGASATVRALTLGAADTLLKPAPGALGGRFAETLRERLLRLCDGRQERAAPVVRRPVGSIRRGAVDCVAIGASTGGLHALAALFEAWPARCDAPILVTQHLPPVFIPYFADQLARMAGRTTHVATEDMRLQRGRIYVAPGTAHLDLADDASGPRVRLVRERTESGCLPSVDPMLTAVARHYGPRGLAIMLSGMGRDGAIGAGRLVDAGGTLLAQDRASSVVWGMPGAVFGIAAEVAPPARLAAIVGERIGAQAFGAWS